MKTVTPAMPRGLGRALVLLACGALPGLARAEGIEGRLVADTPGGLHITPGGLLGRRVRTGVDAWLLPAPRANPGMLEMFRLRDRTPPPDLVPWAGEFVGKYLISAIQTLRLTDDARLERTVAAVVDELIEAQAVDGYLGPFRREERLLGHWDLWGHYHVMLALLMWHDRTEDDDAWTACRKAADLVCRTYLDGDRRVLDAGSPEMNMAIAHVLGALHRRTGEARYLDMVRRVEEEWPEAGDYLHSALQGVEFFRTPRPRWESLHSIQALVELYRITGDERYRRAFLHHWESIRRWDLRNTGGFSSGEQATGNPYEPTAIETCCTIAWMALSVDALRLTGDARVADALELATYNAVLGAQHPSGRWWTYDTPMDGVRRASAHSIVFQARAGTPELNCCSVNGPRGLGMLSEWAIQVSGSSRVVVNHLGGMKARLELESGVSLGLETTTRYPLEGEIKIRLRLDRPTPLTLRVRCPAWAERPRAALVGENRVLRPEPGRHVEVTRTWRAGDGLDLDFGMPLRAEAGDLEAAGKVSVYRGPLLLAWDQALSAFDDSGLPSLTPLSLSRGRLVVDGKGPGLHAESLAPAVVVDIPVGERSIRLCDFASAGARGSRYRSWLPATGFAPPRPVLHRPGDDARVPPGPFVLRWRARPGLDPGDRRHAVVIWQPGDSGDPIIEADAPGTGRFVVPETLANRLEPGRSYAWKVVARNSAGQTESSAPHPRLRVDPSLPRLGAAELSEYGEREGDGAIIIAPLHGSPEPAYGLAVRARGLRPARGPGGVPDGAVKLDGHRSMVVFGIKRYPEWEYTVSLRVRIDELPGHLGQLFSAWHGGMDDPLRLCIDRGQLFARVEARSGWSTAGVPVETGRWMHVAAVKKGPRLILHVDGEERAALEVPGRVLSGARTVAIGGNPNYSGDESLAASFADLRVYARALPAESIRKLAGR